MATFRVHTLDNPANPRDCWGVFASEPATDRGGYEPRVYGPASLLDCCAARSQLILAERHGDPANTQTPSM